ncbi:MAG: prenyltransferase [Chlorobi bacterium]|nr:prenyltransferase [Chlorobiota bacterium]
MPRLLVYWRALRPFSFPASVFPTLTGNIAAAALHRHQTDFSFSLVNMLLTLIGAVAIHATSNVLNDYYDWRSGLDRMDNSGRMNPLVRSELSHRQMLALAAICGVIAVGIGAYVIALCGEPIVWIVAIGAISTWAYTAPPLQLKYRGLGELQVMLSFGVLMTLGSYIVQARHVFTHEAELSVLVLSLPQSLLIAAILHANNHRDRRGDCSARAVTLSVALGIPQRSIVLGKLFVWGAYVVHGVAVVATLDSVYPIPAWTLVAWGTVPLAWRALIALDGSDDPASPLFERVVLLHARLQRIYGALMVLGLAVAAVG